MSAAGRFSVERIRGPVAEIHGRPFAEADAPAVWVADPVDAAVVLGSAQSDAAVDRARASALGLDVVRRRSGGGAVLVVPGELLWVDVVLPVGDPLWDPDVGRAFGWLGETWRDALATLGVAGSVHRGALVRDAVADVVCFAGRGPGEVVVGEAKVVGLSQRRTRGGARFQCALALAWRPAPLLEVMTGLDGSARARVAATAVGIGVPAAEAEAAFLEALARR